MTSFPADDDKDTHDDRESLSKLGQLDIWTTQHPGSPSQDLTSGWIQPESDNHKMIWTYLECSPWKLLLKTRERPLTKSKPQYYLCSEKGYNKAVQKCIQITHSLSQISWSLPTLIWFLQQVLLDDLYSLQSKELKLHFCRVWQFSDPYIQRLGELNLQQ